MEVRKMEISVISDVHLATHASKAKELVRYLKSIHPEKLILNGDFIDSWRFSRNYFPKPHLKVIRQLIKMMEQGIQVVYITGNHDEIFRRFNNTRLGNFSIVNQLELYPGNKKTWIVHGDIFDLIIHQARWLAKLGAAAYGFMSLLNKMINLFRKIFRKQEIMIYKSLKDRILKDRKVLTKFEQNIGELAALKNYDVVICGHTHIPVDKIIETREHSVRYINCGDWVEHFTAAEYNNGKWELVYFQYENEEEQIADELFIPDSKQVYQSILEEFSITQLSFK
ncbi:MAG: UDP-2,3-diacylglucosamine hydrolase [Bacteroidetes bacterium GWF2_42_66]|nr:MAG: UDP-2,3-diacylglucosamine hydrolase [Bacteroidetes bacterium GWA2_42_15]OFX96267.1 MAG: UDP-2,3-diacylglucosamine hydrolase [Bacteroidetes bacterium GWE2_42_39]OFY46306.1 MAG: UDP-2,3-diacylglucosamine hydrolase [Bacteroidetes bacterium GWF2_42_66]HBL78312.1 UDP-2,3-diacylglucosamine hydrolase [Prolixibacteraceae bacterium]HCR90845.1 UDP-2,3-diacylglucosamine hydrolase [Prolixibacteraceae bacterium]